MRTLQRVFGSVVVLSLVGCGSEGPFSNKNDHSKCHLVVRASGDVQIGDSTAKVGQVENLLRKRLEELSGEQIPIREIATTVSAEPNSSVGDLMSTLEVCMGLGLEHLAMEFDNENYPTPRGRDPRPSPDENFTPPVKVRLTADSAGNLSAIEVYGGSSDFACADLTDLQGYVCAYLGDERGPGSILEDARLYLNCDERLQVKHLRTALKAVSYFMDARTGERVELFSNHSISLFPFGDEPEEFQVEEFQSLDIPRFDVEREPEKPSE